MPKDHFVPVFYLKRWSSCNKDGRLYSCRLIDHTGKLYWDSHAPKGTGFEEGLYQEIEEKFFKPLDNDSSRLLTKFEELDNTFNGRHDLGEIDHELWATFLLAQIIRTPTNVNYITSQYAQHDVAPEVARQQIPRIIRNEKAIQDLRAMKWVFASVDANLDLITCDNPVIFIPRNLAHDDCVIIMPMSPRHFFIASKVDNFQRLEKNARKMVNFINIEVIKNARERIYTRNRESIKEQFLLKHWTCR